MKKTKGSPSFRLRHDPLRWSVAGALLLNPVWATAQGIVPVPGAGGTAQVHEQNGIPIVNITAPGPDGLSHNPFSDFNVPPQGLVLNNATGAGASQLAGALSANPQFQGQAASTILNEVVGQLPSNIRGPQEIFGQAADYVLANPNGIHVQGVGFINTPRAIFLVGTPEIQDGRLAALNTFSAPGDLRITGQGLSTEAAVDLIAPRIDSQGDLYAAAGLTAIAGRNRVAADNLAMLETQQPAGQAPSVDLNALGAMKAGRIRLVSTREGAGIRLAGPSVVGEHGVSVDSAGDVLIGREGEGQAMVASIRGDLALNARQDITVTGGRLAGQAIRAKAGRDLTMDASTRESVQRHRDDWRKKTLFITTETYMEESEKRHTRLQETVATAVTDMELEAGRNVTLRGSKLQAGGAMDIRGGEAVTVEAGMERIDITEKVRHRKHLWRGDRNERSHEERAVPSELKAASVNISAGGKATVRGSDITSDGDLNIRARSIKIDSQGMERTATRDDYRGDLVDGWVFGDTGAREETSTRQRGSNLKAEGTARLVSDDVLIKGSTVEGKAGTFTVGENGPVIIASAADITHVKDQRKDRKLAGVFGTDSSSTREREQAVPSHMKTQGDSKIVSAEHIRVVGSIVEAEGKNDLEAKGNIDIVAAQNRQKEHSSTSTGSLTASAGETRTAEDGKDGSSQYYAQVSYRRDHSEGTSNTVEQAGASVLGGTVDAKAGDTISVISSTVESLNGDTDVAAKAFRAISELNDTTTSSKTSTTTIGEKVTAGIDRVGAGHAGEHVTESKQTRRATAAQAIVKSAGDVNLDVEGEAKYAGALIDAKGKVNETAGSVRHTAVADIDEKQEQRTHYTGETMVSAEYKDISGPLKKAFEGQEQTRFQQQGVEDAMVPPSLGADAMASYTHREHSVRTETPTVTTLKASEVNVTLPGALEDEGTRYTATGGQVAIQAGSHDARAATEKYVETLNRTDVEASLRVDTTTGSDINVRLDGKGSRKQTLEERDTARPTQFIAQAGIPVQLGTDGRYEGTVWDTGNGALSIKLGGDLSMPQATNRQHKEESNTSGYGLVKAGNAPGGTNALFMGGLEHQTLTTTDTQGVGGRIKTPDGQVDVTGNARLEGVAVGNGNAPTNVFEVKAGGTATLAAKVDTHEAQGQTLGGALQAGLSRNPTADAQRTGGSLGGHADMGRVNEQSERRTGAELNVANLTVKAGAHEAVAVQLEGTQLAGDNLHLNAANGGIHIKAARSTEHKDNVQATAGAGLNGSRGLDKDDDASALYARARLNLDNVNSTTHENADLRVKNVTFDSAMDTQLTGAVVAADNVNGTVGGDLVVSSAQDSVSSTQVQVDGRIGKETNPQGLLNGLKSVTGPFADKATEKVGKQVQAMDLTVTPTLLVDVENEQRDTVARVASLSGRQGIDLNVAGETRLSGAKLRSGEGKVELGSSEVRLNALAGRDYRADVSINASNGPAELLSGVISELTASRSEQAMADEHGNVGVIRTGGHDRSETFKAAVEERRQ